MPCRADIDDQHSQLIDVVLAERRNAHAARTFSPEHCPRHAAGADLQITTYRAQVYRSRSAHTATVCIEPVELTRSEDFEVCYAAHPPLRLVVAPPAPR